MAFTLPSAAKAAFAAAKLKANPLSPLFLKRAKSARRQPWLVEKYLDFVLRRIHCGAWDWEKQSGGGENFFAPLPVSIPRPRASDVSATARALRGAKKPVVVVTYTATPLDLTEVMANEKVGAILHVGQPSVTVVGVGELLFGKTSPAGRTVQTIYPVCRNGCDRDASACARG